MRSCGTVPLISPWLFRQAVRKTARRASKGDIAAAQELAAVFCTSTDDRIRSLARDALLCLELPGQADLLCRECMLRADPALTDLVLRAGYMPANMAERALFFVHTSQVCNLLRLDRGVEHPLLAQGYAAAPAAIRARARDAARRDKVYGILSRALAGPAVTQHAGSWSYGEWEVVAEGFTEEKRWEDLWLLVPLMPLPLAVRAVRSLDLAGWSPKGDDLLVWNHVSRSLPERWEFPAPAQKAGETVGRPGGQVSRICFSRDGSLLATGCCDGFVTVRRSSSAGTAVELGSLAGSITFLAIHPNNSALFSCGDDGILRGYRLPDRDLLWSRDNAGKGSILHISPDGESIFAGDRRGTLHTIGTRDGRILHTFPLHPAPVTCFAPSSSGSMAACGHADGMVTVFAPGSGTSPGILPGNGSPVRTLALASSGTECLAIYESGHAALWDIQGCTKIRTFHGHRGRTICGTVSPDGTWFAAGCDDHMLRCWSMASSAPAATIPLYSRHISSCSASPDGRRLAAGFLDGSVRIWRMPDGKLLRECKAHKKTVTSCTFTRDSNRLATVSWDSTTKIWRVPTMEIVRTLDAHNSSIVALAGPAGGIIAAVTADGTARIIDCRDRSVIRVLDLYTPEVRSAALSADGFYLATTGKDASLRIWNAREGTLAASGDRAKTSFWCCTFMPDGSGLVVGGWDGICRVCSVPDMVPFRTFPGHTSTITCCTVSPDGSLLVTGSNDTTVRLFRLEEDEAYAILRESRSEIRAVAISPDTTLLATGNAKGTISLYQIPCGTPEPGLPMVPGSVSALAFTPDNCILAAGFDSGICAIFRLDDRSLIRTIPAHSGAVTGISILPDGRTIVTAGADGTCRFHPMPWIPFLAHAGSGDLAAGETDAVSRPQQEKPGTASFHRALLQARFKGEIGICPVNGGAGCYDIEIVG